MTLESAVTTFYRASSLYRFPQ